MGPARTMSLAELEPGKEYEGVIVSIRDFGAFVNIGCQTDGLLHISQVGRGAGRGGARVCKYGAGGSGTNSAAPAPPPACAAWAPLAGLPTKHPRPLTAPRNAPPPCPFQISTDFVRNVGDVVANGQEVRVRVMSVDAERGKFAVTMIPEGAAPTGGRAGRGDDEGDLASGERPARKQQARAPKAARARRAAPPCKPGDVVKGKVVSVAAFGAFVEVRSGERGVGPAAGGRGAGNEGLWLRRCLPLGLLLPRHAARA